MNLFDTRNEDGKEIANCTSMKIDPEIFFDSHNATQEQAKAICLWCPLRMQCLDFAIAEDMNHGIWGGLTPDERFKLRGRTRSRKGIPNKKH